MGKGYVNYMNKKFFHPSNFSNIKRKWIAEQKADFSKKKDDEMLAQYKRDQEVLENRVLLGDKTARMGISFLYDAPPGLQKDSKKEEADEKLAGTLTGTGTAGASSSSTGAGGASDVKFEWQRKYIAPRESYAKGDSNVRDNPFGIEVRTVRCLRCKQWGHTATDRVCPLFGISLTSEPPPPTQPNQDLVASLREKDGLQFKRSAVVATGFNEMTTSHTLKLLKEDEELTAMTSDDPEIQFLRSLNPEQRKKLLKKLERLEKSADKKPSAGPPSSSTSVARAPVPNASASSVCASSSSASAPRPRGASPHHRPEREREASRRTSPRSPSRSRSRSHSLPRSREERHERHTPHHDRKRNHSPSGSPEDSPKPAKRHHHEHKRERHSKHSHH